MENKEKIELLSQLIEGAETSIKAARQILDELIGGSSGSFLNSKITSKAKSLNVSEEGKVIEGVFDGEHMIGPDDKKYPIPANYASKSKLVQGDVLKLTINADGSFIFKQIGPIERKKVVGTLTYADGEYRVLAEGKAYKVLFASITYFKVQAGDSVTLVVPKDGNSEWGAIENVIHNPESTPSKNNDQDLSEVQSGEPLNVDAGLSDLESFEKEETDISDLLTQDIQENKSDDDRAFGDSSDEPEEKEEVLVSGSKRTIPEKEVKELEI